MPLSTGIPEGNVLSQDEIFVEGAPYIYYQNADASLLHTPDGDGFYWGLSGTSTYPVYALACYEDVSLSDDLQINSVRCDQVGDRAVIQKRNHLVFSFSLSSLFPLANTSPLIRGSTVTTSAPLEKMGLGTINNNIFYHIYLPKVYDSVANDFVSITLHRAQFVDPWTIAMVSGDKWMLGGISAWALAATNTASGQEFATVIRYDPSAIA
jgi:hypothetical protein